MLKQKLRPLRQEVRQRSRPSSPAVPLLIPVRGLGQIFHVNADQVVGGARESD